MVLNYTDALATSIPHADTNYRGFHVKYFEDTRKQCVQLESHGRAVFLAVREQMLRDSSKDYLVLVMQLVVLLLCARCGPLVIVDVACVLINSI